MADKKPDQEPSIEEILASIRQIISDDEEGAPDSAPVAAPPPPAREPPPPPVNDIIDLTEKVDPEPESVFVGEPDPIQVDLRESQDDSAVSFVEEIPEEEDSPPLTGSRYADESEIDSLLTEKARDAALNAFSKITARAPINRPDAPENGHTIEDVVRALLRPMLREWLDDHLPPLIERLVQRELEKLARRALSE